VDQITDFALVFSEDPDRFVDPPKGKAFIVLNLKLHTSNPNIDRYLYPSAFSILDEQGENIPSFGIGLEQFSFIMGSETFCVECGFELDENGDMDALVLFAVKDTNANQLYRLKFADVPPIAFLVENK
jgi:hypothetical protein